MAKLSVTEQEQSFVITTRSIAVRFDKASSQFSIATGDGRIVVQSVEPVSFEANKTMVKLREAADEYFYGGGVQNGRFFLTRAKPLPLKIKIAGRMVVLHLPILLLEHEWVWGNGIYL
ncbi:hypothetical protein LWM68_00565 [Niabella sp. W65]|nr:hypothetical protein [Niabella sp. W65]MCH7361408.1 hypothetical protein [Niabella sp. W65]